MNKAEYAAQRYWFAHKMIDTGADKRHVMAPDYPILNEDNQHDYDHHYIYHTAWAARILAITKPQKHIDVGSFLYFSTLVSAFIPVEFYDYRPIDVDFKGLTVGNADLTALPFGDRSIESLSCMHVVEHIGLGRYGDPLDPDGDLKAMRELQRVIAPGGQLLFVVPVGKPEIFFNAHRVYLPSQVSEAFNELEGVFYEPTPGCGCFVFRREVGK